MDDRFRIFVEQLRDGETESIHESFSPDFLEIREKELQFIDPINIQGKAYLAEDSLVMHLDVDTACILPCSICNAPVKTPLEIKGFYHVVPLNEVKGGVFNFKNILRETILLETPHFAECNEGNCQQRKQIEKYLKKDNGNLDPDQEGYHPFADLNFNEEDK